MHQTIGIESEIAIESALKEKGRRNENERENKLDFQSVRLARTRIEAVETAAIREMDGTIIGAHATMSTALIPETARERVIDRIGLATSTQPSAR